MDLTDALPAVRGERITMDKVLGELRQELASGTRDASGWSGVNSPGHLERGSGLWVSHGTARWYPRGTTSAAYVNPLWEWATVIEGTIALLTAARIYTITAPRCYIVPPGLCLGVQIDVTATLVAWFMVDGPLTGEALAACGGHPDQITAGAYRPEQACHALRIARLLYARPPGFPMRLQSELWAFLAAAEAPAREQRRSYSPEIERVLCYLDDRPSGRPASNTALAQLAALAPASFLRRFTAEIGMPPRHYQLRQRLRQAKHLLISDTTSIKAVAYELGFADQLYFSRLFARHEGVSPKEFRRRFAAERAWRHRDVESQNETPVTAYKLPETGCTAGSGIAGT